MSGYSVDLRERVIKARQEGKTQAWIAQTFRLSVSSVKRYVERFKRPRTVEAPQQHRQPPIIHDGYEVAIGALVQRLPEATLKEYCEVWEQENGQRVSIQTMSCTLIRFGWPRKKKTIGATERDEVARQDGRSRAETLPARRIVAVDSCSTHRHMTPRYARARRGQRAYSQQPGNYGSTVTLLSGRCLEAMTAALVVEGSVTTAVFEAYVRQVLCPTLHADDMVILDNLTPHHAPAVATLIQDRGAYLLF